MSATTKTVCALLTATLTGAAAALAAGPDFDPRALATVSVDVRNTDGTTTTTRLPLRDGERADTVAATFCATVTPPSAGCEDAVAAALDERLQHRIDHELLFYLHVDATPPVAPFLFFRGDDTYDAVASYLVGHPAISNQGNFEALVSAALEKQMELEEASVHEDAVTAEEQLAETSSAVAHCSDYFGKEFSVCLSDLWHGPGGLVVYRPPAATTEAKEALAFDDDDDDVCELFDDFLGRPVGPVSRNLVAYDWSAHVATPDFSQAAFLGRRGFTLTVDVPAQAAEKAQAIATSSSSASALFAFAAAFFCALCGAFLVHQRSASPREHPAISAEPATATTCCQSDSAMVPDNFAVTPFVEDKENTPVRQHRSGVVRQKSAKRAAFGNARVRSFGNSIKNIR